MGNDAKRNKYCFGLGTVGRDMFYTMVSSWLLVYMTEVLDLPDATMWGVTGVFTVLRVFDAFNDPFMGVVVDNTRSRWGKFKPWMTLGAILGGICMMLMFTDLGLSGAGYVVTFAILYLSWDVVYGLNDIAYWSMLPALSVDPGERERIGAFARICANVGLFTVTVGILPITDALGKSLGSLKTAWFVFACAVVLLLWGFQAITVFGVREKKNEFKEEEKTSVREMFSVLFKNDQLLFVAVAMALFMIGYCTTTSFGAYYFKYVCKDESGGLYSVFAAILGVSQLSALALFPRLGRKYTRRQLYTVSTVLVVAGYAIFFAASANMVFIGVAGVLIFVGQAFIQLMMYMFLADTVEYGQWKLHKRNESVTFSVMPFINKIGGAIATGVVSATLIVSGVNAATDIYDVTEGGILIMKLSMLILPLLLIFLSYIVYRRKYIIDAPFHARIVAELKARGDIRE